MTVFDCVSVAGPNGHKGAVRCLALSDGEHYFVSGSKDKTAKIWNLRNQGKGSGNVGCQLTYGGHQKPVVAVELLERIDTVASCDGTLQVDLMAGSVCMRERCLGCSDHQVELMAGSRPDGRVFA